jgi:hypothetical protein
LGTHVEQSHAVEQGSNLNRTAPLPIDLAIGSPLNPIAFMQQHSLNEKQSYAFGFLCLRLLARREDPEGKARRLVIVGSAGVGKSVCINTYTEWITACGLQGFVRRSATTNTAAAKIRAVTTQSLIGLRPKKGRDDGEALEADRFSLEPAKVNVKASVRDEWKGVLQHIIDEFSMLGQNLHEQLHAVMSAVYGLNGEPFGNVEQAYVGDPYQFKPVKDKALHTKSAFKINHWDQLTDAIVLTEIMRQDPGELQWIKLLNRLRARDAQDDDFAQLNNLIVGSPGAADISHSSWDDALFITKRHSLRRAVNARRAESFASAHGRDIFVHVC